MKQINVTPYKISLQEMEILVDETTRLRPGQLLCFEGEDGQAVYGRVDALRVAPRKDEDGGHPLNVRVHIILGEPDFSLVQARVLDPADMGNEVRRIQGEVEYPFTLGQGFEGDFQNLDTLTVIEGAALPEKIRLLRSLIGELQSYQHLLIIDPLGILGNYPGAQVLRAGLDAGLSLQAVGLKRFLDYLSVMLPDIVRAETLHWLAEAIPLGQTFYPFKDLLALGNKLSAQPAVTATQPQHTPLMNCLYEIDRQRVFANAPREVFSLQATSQRTVTVLDLSSLTEPWKTLFYEEVCLEVLANADSGLIPVLLYPENYLKSFEDYIRKANEADLTLLVLASPYLSESLLTMADNRFYWNAMGDILLEGGLSFGLPVCLGQLPEHDPPASPTTSPIEHWTSATASDAVPSNEPADWTVLEPSSSSAQFLSPGSTTEAYQDITVQQEAVWELTDSPEPTSPAPASQPTGSVRQTANFDSPGFDSADVLQTLYNPPPTAQPAVVPHPQDYYSQAYSPEEYTSSKSPVIQPEDWLPEAARIEAAQPQPQEDAQFDSILGSIPEVTQGWSVAEEDEFRFDPDLDIQTAQQALRSSPGNKNLEENRLDLLPGAPPLLGRSPYPASPAAPSVSPTHAPAIRQSPESATFSQEPPDAVYSMSPESEPEDFALDVSPESYAGSLSPESSTDVVLTPEPPPVVQKSADDSLANSAFQAGDRVQSDKYGVGTVQKIIPMEMTTAVHVLFDNGAKRTIVPSPTNLQKI